MRIEKELFSYETPQLEIVKVTIEKGFAASPTGDGEGNMDGGGNGWN